MDIFLKILFVILSYFLGSIPFGFLIGKMKGVDLRKEGSKNIGATNAGRVLGKKYAVLTYILDMLKGATFVFLFRFTIIPAKYCLVSPMLYGFIATIGHAFPIYLKFKGGKSVSCGCGAVCGYAPILLPILLIVFFIIKKISKLVSFSSLICTIITVLIVLGITLISKDFLLQYSSDLKFWPYNYWYLIFTCLIGGIVYLKHLPNIKRIFKHEENPINY